MVDNLNRNNLRKMSKVEFIKILKDMNIEFIITYNMAGRYYGWGGTHPTLDIIIPSKTETLLKIKRIFQLPDEIYKRLKIGGKFQFGLSEHYVLYQIWTEIGYRKYEDFSYEEYKGYKIISQRDLIDTIKYQPIHTELRAKLALRDDAIKDSKLARVLMTCVAA